ncbi:MAG TPA: NADH-quinone oxidoreductase subunit B family protein [Nitrososphaerales archaeon]|nr:NADH-quinone oxidoreductase subunit B family protein [Nitrososphaerales archaeon]
MAGFRSGLTQWARKRSVWVFHVNAASCNGCDIEILAALTPRYDAERLGVELVPSPRHADVLLVTGTLNPLMRDRLKTVYEQMPEPRHVVAIGACALGGGVMKDCYNVGHGIDAAVPVDLYIPGCPPRPEAIIYGILKLVTGIPDTAVVGEANVG